MQFEWDEKKNKVNFAKHGIDFLSAIEIFSDQMAIEAIRMINGEERWQIIGTIDNLVFSVAYTLRGKNRRIISARLASKKERQVYGRETTVCTFKKTIR